MEEAKGLIITGVITLLILVGGIFFLTKNNNTPPSPKIVDQNILIKSDSHQTKADAKVNLVEFGDFQCPACAQEYPIIQQLKKEYGDKVNFVFRNFPLAQHKNAMIAAEAAEAANAQGKFWEMHDKLYENQNDWAESDKPIEKFLVYAKDLKLDIDKFKKEIEEKKHQSFISNDVSDGNVAGITGTPTFFINGQQLSVMPNFAEFKSVIDLLLK